MKPVSFGFRVGTIDEVIRDSYAMLLKENTGGSFWIIGPEWARALGARAKLNTPGVRCPLYTAPGDLRPATAVAQFLGLPCHVIDGAGRPRLLAPDYTAPKPTKVELVAAILADYGLTSNVAERIVEALT